ncbi:GNAT family N-acetyltransferase [Aestuariibacter sp. AA17]|uniref:GNAT family N-acetyltransferase n=1 Tax=Fluctibacter corallii TaxID=2984329 RepID=A0ABT3A661_9ALTE|nr:GNAT family N-acetyltransferase [Aestuariibacter sp. AA17]MCV2883762.1 GNAT family N-acetyltransferase [Aestuariibacter sp. AA17]
MEFRQATVTDISNIAKLHARSWRETYSDALSATFLQHEVEKNRENTWIKRLTTPEPNQRVIVAELDGVFCGFICAFGGKHPTNGTIIDNLHVYSEYKGKGIGTKLLHLAALWAKENYPTHGIYLEVLKSNPNAIRFYESLGGKRAGEAIWNTPCGNSVSEYVYRWDTPDTLTNAKQTA